MGLGGCRWVGLVVVVGVAMLAVWVQYHALIARLEQVVAKIFYCLFMGLAWQLHKLGTLMYRE